VSDGYDREEDRMERLDERVELLESLDLAALDGRIADLENRVTQLETPNQPNPVATVTVTINTTRSPTAPPVVVPGPSVVTTLGAASISNAHSNIPPAGAGVAVPTLTVPTVTAPPVTVPAVALCLSVTVATLHIGICL